MTALEALRKALEEMNQGIANADAALISESVKRLDALLSANKSSLDPQLVHYLSRRSYEKALMHLNAAGNIPKGICGK